MKDLERDYRKPGKFAELRKLIAVGCQMARFLESRGDDELAAAWLNQLMKMRATNELQREEKPPKCSGCGLYLKPSETEKGYYICINPDCDLSFNPRCEHCE